MVFINKADYFKSTSNTNYNIAIESGLTEYMYYLNKSSITVYTNLFN